MANGSDFEKRMRRHGRNIENNAVTMVRRATLAIDTALVLATPVDTGRARANWQASLNAPPGGEIPAYSAGTAGSTAALNAREAIAQAEGVAKRSRPGDSIWLTNNLPYIGRLNEGSSAQAPAGFVQTAVLVGARAVKGFSIVKGPRR